MNKKTRRKDPDLKSDHENIRKHLSDNNISNLYHFTDRRNLDSIRKNGGLYSLQYCIRHNIKIHAGGNEISQQLDTNNNLNDYVHLSFCNNHPMMYRLSQEGKDIVILQIKVEVAELESTLFSDMNAAANDCLIGGTLDDLKRVDLKATRQHKTSRNTDIILFKKHQAEVLVKTFIPIDMIVNIDNPIEYRNDSSSQQEKED
ncbi:MAG: DUF4433 domain-containing protein [Candidatus Cryptobacteroides sp.]